MAKSSKKEAAVSNVPALVETPKTPEQALATLGIVQSVAVATRVDRETNISFDDMLRPRMKLLQGLSPEVKDQGMPAGNFFIDSEGTPIEGPVYCTVIASKMRYVLWNPQRNVEPAVLATSEDGMTWDKNFQGEETANREFEVMIKNVGKVRWKTLGNVAESGLAEFGSSVPNDPKSKPAASKTFEYLLYLHQYPGMMPVAISLSRSQIKKAKMLNTLAYGNSIHGPHAIAVKMTSIMETGDDGDYFNYTFARAGLNNPDLTEQLVALGERFKGFKTTLPERDDDRPLRAAPDLTNAEY